MNVLSCFDGISCGRVALERAGIPVTNYYTSEIDKWAEKVSQDNWPSNIRLGDINNWKEWDIDFSTIDLVFAGSPCVSFSNAGKRGGFEDDRGKLFYVFCDLLNHIKSLNPHVKFLFENVRMKYEHENVITDCLGVPPLKIDSRTLSPLSRPRIYWSNFLWNPLVEGEETEQQFVEKSCGTDGEILFARTPKPTYKTIGDIIEPVRDDMPWLTEKAIDRLANINRRAKEKGLGYKDCTLTESDVFLNLDANFFKGPDGKRGVIQQGGRLRMPTPIECERMMGLQDNYTANVSNTQRYKGCGNGWSVDVIVFLLHNLK